MPGSSRSGHFRWRTLRIEFFQLPVKRLSEGHDAVGMGGEEAPFSTLSGFLFVTNETHQDPGLHSLDTEMRGHR